MEPVSTEGLGLFSLCHKSQGAFIEANGLELIYNMS